jgi:hypothetical protein
VLLEVLAGWDAPLAVPGPLAAYAERRIDRGRGKVPAALRDVLPPARTPAEVARFVGEALAARAAEHGTLDLDVPLARVADVDREDDPVPEGLRVAPPVACPIGWLDVAASPARAWIGGDGLVPGYARAALASAVAEGDAIPSDLGDAPLDGVTLAELAEAAGRALSLARTT